MEGLENAWEHERKQSMSASNTLLVPRIESRIQVIRGLRVMIDGDLATLYGVQTKRLNEQVKRNRERFPADFLFQLKLDEKTEVVANCDHLQKLKFSRVLPFVFTEHDTFSRNTRLQLRQLLDAVRELTTPPEPRKRPIGFLTPEDRKTPKASKTIEGKKSP